MLGTLLAESFSFLFFFLPGKLSEQGLCQKGYVKALINGTRPHGGKLGPPTVWNESFQIRSASQRGSVLSISSCQWAHVVLAARGGVLGNHSALLFGSDFRDRDLLLHGLVWG